jgi:hypothetical protein
VYGLSLRAAVSWLVCLISDNEEGEGGIWLGWLGGSQKLRWPSSSSFITMSIMGITPIGPSGTRVMRAQWNRANSNSLQLSGSPGR